MTERLLAKRLVEHLHVSVNVKNACCLMIKTESKRNICVKSHDLKRRLITK